MVIGLPAPYVERPRLLVVDDEAALRRLLDRYFTCLGYEVASAAALGEARSALDAAPFDFLITDLELGPFEPEGGLAVIDHARTRHPRIRVIVVTALELPEVEAECRRHGADRLLLKPLPLHALARGVEELARTDPEAGGNAS